MYKPNNKKMLTVLIAVAMIFSAFAILSFAAEPAYAAASGTVSYTPTTVTAAQVESSYAEIGTTGVYTPIIAASGGTFGSGSTVYFYWSTTDSSAGLIPTATGGTSLTYAFSTGLGANQVSLSNTVLTPNTAWSSTVALTGGETLYLLASDTAFTSTTPPSGAQFASSSPFTVTVPHTLAPTLLLSSTATGTATNHISVASGGKVYVSGSGYSSGATSATIYFNYDGSSQILGTVSISAGAIVVTALTVPTAMPELPSPGYYGLVAAANSGETADAALEITPAVTFTPNVVGNTAGQVISISGTGFLPNGYIQTNNAIASPTETNAQVQVGADGSFTVSVTTTGSLSSPPATVPITVNEYSTPTSTSVITSAVGHVYTSAPSYNAMTVLLTLAGSSSGSYISGSTGHFEALDFPASTSFELMVGPVAAESFTTNAVGGFAGSFVIPATLPYVSSGYTVTAVNAAMGLYAQTPATLTIDPNATVSMLSPGYSYLPSGYLEDETGTSTFVVSGTGFGADLPIAIVSSSGGSSGQVSLYFSPSSTLFTSGATDMFILPAGKAHTNLNGSFNVTILLDANGDSVFAMSTLVTLTAYTSTVAATTINAFKEYVSPSITVSATGSGVSGQAGASYTSTNLDIITVSSASLLPSEKYSLMFGSSVITTFTTTTTGAIGTTTGISVSPAPLPATGSIAFVVPSLSSGYYPINFALSGSNIAIADPVSSFFLITNAGSNPTVVVQDVGGFYTGAPAVAGLGVGSSASDVVGDTINVFAYNFPAGSNTFKFFGADSILPATGPTAYTATGAYLESSGGAVTIPAVPGGSYLISAEASNSVSGPQVAAPSNAAIFTVIGYLTGTSYISEAGVYGYETTVGASVTFGATGLAPNTNYVGVFNGQVLLNSNGVPITYLTDSMGSLSSQSFTVPNVYASQTNGFSLYNFSLAPFYSQKTLVTTANVAVDFPSTITISPDPQAFPGEMVSFTWTPTTEPSLTSTSSIDVTVYLNNLAYTTVLGTFVYSSPASTSYIEGAFNMPNGVPNTIFALSFGWSYSFGSDSVLGSTLGSSTLSQSYIGTSMAPIELVNGTGASVVSISAAGIASIITSSVDQALAVPLSELSANITALHGDIATITTSFGTMTATLQAINATVASIESGQVVVMTKLGSIETSLASLNASLTAFNGNVAMINTTLGQVQTSLSSIGTQVTANANGIATIKTDLGTVQGQIVSTNGNISTIKTSLGTLTANVSTVQKQTSGFPTLEIFLIVIIVLVLITLVVAFLAVSAANKAARRATEEKKQ